MNPLAKRYLDAVLTLPAELRVRRALEARAIDALEQKRHLCIRGFWRIGKTELMMAALAGVCRRLKSNGFFLDLRDPDNDDGLQRTAASALGRIAARTKAFLGQAGMGGLPVRDDDPLAALAGVSGRVFVGIDELIALHPLGDEGMAAFLEVLKAAPPNVTLVLVCHRHRAVNATFARDVEADARFDTLWIPPLSAKELEHIVQTPAKAEGAHFDDASLELLGELTGHKPWEVFSLCHIAAATLPEGFTGEIGRDRLGSLLRLDALTADPTGEEVVQNCLRIYATAMTDDERALIDLLARGGEGKVKEEVVADLEAAGWIAREPWRVNGELFRALAAAVASGEIKVRVER